MGLFEDATTAIEDPGPWSIIIFGDYGAGKTVLASAAQGAYLLDCEKSRRSLLNHPELHHVPIKKCPTLTEAKQFEVKLRNDKDERIKTVIVDTVDYLQITTLNTIMKEVLAKDSTRDPDLPSQAEFNRVNRRIQRFCEELLNTCARSERNVIFLCHIREEKDNEGHTVLTRPAITDGLLKVVAPMVDGIFYMSHRANSKGEVDRKLHIVPTAKVIGKNRFANLPNVIESPEIWMIEEAANKQRQLAEKS